MGDFLVSVSLGLFGIAAGGALALGLATLVRRRQKSLFEAAPASLTALIPAHDEQENLPVTLASVRAAAEKAGWRVRIVVGADACGDGTAELAARAGAEVRAYTFRSKWKTLSALAEAAAPGDWVALVDAGAVWPDTLLTDLAPLLADGTLLGVAPAYFPAGASRAERLLWSLEARWKSLENAAGGPVSVHGATVFYRGSVLRAALDFLAGKRRGWLNDDVVIPFTARRLFPFSSLRYWCPSDVARRVSDVGLREDASDFGRRLRMVAGNLEWALHASWPPALLSFSAAGLVGVRRFLRVFWAYWGLCLAFAACSLLAPSREAAGLATLGALVAGCASLAALGRGRLVEAMAASLLAPFLFVRVLLGRRQAWS